MVKYITLTHVTCHMCGQRVRILPALVMPDDIDRQVMYFRDEWGREFQRSGQDGHSFGKWHEWR